MVAVNTTRHTIMLGGAQARGDQTFPPDRGEVDRKAQFMRSFQRKLDSIDGITPKISLDIQRDFKIEDSVGQLAAALCANENFLPRLFDKHIPSQQKMLLVHALGEKLKTATPEVFTADFTSFAHAHVKDDRIHGGGDFGCHARDKQGQRQHQESIRSSAPDKANKAKPRTVVNEASLGALKKKYADGESKRRVLSEIMPITAKVAGLTLGKFKNDASRCALFMTAADDGSRAGGFLRAVCGTRFKVSSELASGATPTNALKGALERLPADVLEDPRKRLKVFEKMVEDCAKSAQGRAPLNRTFFLSDVVSAVSSAH